MLRSNVTLTALDLRNNYLTDVSARALSASLAQTKTLRLCHLQGNDITPQMWASLEQLVADPANSLESIEGADNATAELMGTVCLLQ